MIRLDHEGDCSGACSSCPAVGSCAERIVCRCLRVTEERIIDAIRSNSARTLIELRQLTEAGDGCTCCHRELLSYLRVYAPAEEPAEAAV